MQYMIIETFHPGKGKALYAKFEKEGRLLPQGVQYINSWIDETVSTCYQVMESESLEKLQEWIGHWKEFADFKVIPVISSAQAKDKVLKS
jgi:uncharacterized protein YjaG (DUF416 family)